MDGIIEGSRDNATGGAVGPARWMTPSWTLCKPLVRGQLFFLLLFVCIVAVSLASFLVLGFKFGCEY